MCLPISLNYFFAELLNKVEYLVLESFLNLKMSLLAGFKLCLLLVTKIYESIQYIYPKNRHYLLTPSSKENLFIFHLTKLCYIESLIPHHLIVLLQIFMIFNFSFSSQICCLVMISSFSISSYLSKLLSTKELFCFLFHHNEKLNLVIYVKFPNSSQN